MPIYKTARFQVKSRSIEKCKAAVREFVTYVQNNEPGTLLYTAQQEVEDPTQFMHFFIFTDAEAEETHRTSDAVKHFTGILYPETVDGVVFTDYTLVASTDN